MTSEAEDRARIVAIARSWIGTPYMSNAMVKKAGVDCAMLPLAVYKEAGFIPADFDPRPYPPQWHLHRGEEMYMNYVKKFAGEIVGPPELGDFALFRIGRLFAHGGVVTTWPKIIHARAPGPAYEEDLSTNTFGRYALWNTDMKFFSRWKKDETRPSPDQAP